MPKRSNQRQQVVEMLRTLAAVEGAVVTPSKMLPHMSGGDREVDVVVEHHVDGETFTQSFEVVDHGRPATVEWVERMLKKHEGLPTDRLCLVSWSGFSAGALRIIDGHRDVVAVTPQAEGGSVSLVLYEATLNLERMTFTVVEPSGDEVLVAAASDTAIFDASGAVRGTAWQLGTYIIGQPSIGRQFIDCLHGDERLREARWFEFEIPKTALPPPAMWLRSEADGALHEVAHVKLAGGAVLGQRPLALAVYKAVQKVSPSAFGHAQTKIGAAEMQVVAMMDPELTVTKVAVEPAKAGKKVSAKST
jgi:hypothetical protein